MRYNHQKKLTLACLLLPFLLSHCAMHHLEIPQGSPLKESDIAQIKEGMTPQEVEHIVGTAPIKDPFHKGRWDYIFYTTAQESAIKKTHLTLQFNQGVLEKIERKY